MFSYLRIPRQTCLFLACQFILLARQINVASASSDNSCAERNIPTSMKAIQANLEYLSETFSGVLNRQIRLADDLTNEEIEGILLRFAKIAPKEAREFIDYIGDAYEDMMEKWLLRCQPSLRQEKRGGAAVAIAGNDAEPANQEVAGETYSFLWSQLKRNDVKHPLYRVPRSAKTL